MKLTLQRRDGPWYIIGDNVFASICARGLVTNHLLPQDALDNLPAELYLFFFFKNPKKAGFKKIDFIKNIYGWNVGSLALTHGVRMWINAHIPGAGHTDHFSVWVKLAR